MKNKPWKLLVMIAAMASVTIQSGCKKDSDVEKQTDLSNQKVRQFALDVLTDVYLWSSKIPTVDVTKDVDPITMVDSIKYSADHWTTLTDDVNALNNNFAGDGTSFGYSLGVYLFAKGSTQCYAVVQFVYPGTPAEKAGLKRGNVILQINGSNITTSNYTNLFNASSIKLGMATLSGSTISLNGSNISLTAVSTYQEPVNTYKVIQKGSHKVGYLFYTDFTLTSNQKLGDVFKEFKTAGVTDVVLDLRYNPGGYSLSAQILSSILAPSAVVSSGKQVYLQQMWNDKYNTYWAKKGTDLNEYFMYNFNYTDDDNKNVSISVQDANMNLSKLYVLITENGTASASEATITGLSPYMNVITIGDGSAGKYCGGMVFEPSDVYDTPDKALDNWGIYAMVYRYADKNGNTSCMPNGFTPTYTVYDNPFDGYSMGNESEPLLAKALALITGDSQTVTSTAASQFKPTILRGARSRAGALSGKLIKQRGNIKLTK